jgi:phosphoadenosine phosphosulfate reductase
MSDGRPTTIEDLVNDSTKRLRAYLADGKTVISSSSFQTHSIPMLVILAEVGSIPVYFLDTGYHFPETLTYRDEVTAMLGIEVISLRSPVTKLAQRSRSGNLLFTDDPDYCCYLNKTAPMEAAAAECDVWVSGVRRTQNENRSTFDQVMPGPGRSIRYHPMLDWTDEMIQEFLDDHEIRPHPLDGQGYTSVGCAPCTSRVPDGLDPRDARWSGQTKTECGLHIELVRR